ncbi:N-acetylmuramate alpha-1-phosphate uridylyltransferase MurU [Marinimicrobium alkaliphilum]|uniref:N-acetylmuramate alpha-1-phosphate uridylyltransferase MurU n=1 Tax=Marinimicrobium alkaliphilum TaxID=2202654 RepID=UPI000DB9656A|nr:nucleotidyltransferase family protein [Marinimicrobium alkaliphilum]
MKAMILAAGLGKRMRPLTDHTPKPLLPVAGKPLIQYHLEGLAAAGVSDVVINLAYLGEQIEAFVGTGAAFGVRVHYSREPEPLETGGALVRALPLLGEAPFILVNGDVWSDYPLLDLVSATLPDAQDGHLVLVPNPEFHGDGDFALPQNPGLIGVQGPRFTFSGISLLRPRLIAEYPERRLRFALVETLRWAIARGALSGELYHGRWNDVGTPARLAELDRLLQVEPAGSAGIVN